MNILREHKYNYLNEPVNLGIGGAIQTGYRYARDNRYAIAVQLDGDGQHDPQYIEALIAPILESRCDYSIGSRFLHGENDDEIQNSFKSTRLRRIGIHLLSGLIWILTGKKVRDVTSGFRAVNRYFIEVFADDYPDDYPEPKAIVDAVMRRRKILEVPVIMHERDGGGSSINLRRSIYYMIKVTLDLVVCRISYGIRRGPRVE